MKPFKMIIGSSRKNLKIVYSHLKPARSYCSKPVRKGEIDLNGIFLPVPTPFEKNEKQSLCYEMLHNNVRKWESIPLKGYCVGGTNGEWPFLNDEEKLSLIRVLKSETEDGKIIIAGTTSESTLRTCQLSEAAAEAGADAVLVMTPFYFKSRMTEKVIIDHFEKIADSIPIPIIIYNMTFVTGIDISINAVKVLATHPNICGIKDSDVVKIGCLVQETKNNNFSVLAGSAGYLLPALQMGCSGGINGLAAVLGQDLCNLHALVRKNEWTKAIEMQKRLIQIDYLLLRTLGPPGLKAAMDILGYSGGVCRKPLPSLEKETKTKIEEVLKQQKFL